MKNKNFLKFFSVIIFVIILTGIGYLMLNFPGIKKNFFYDRGKNLAIFQQESEKTKSEPNRIEIPALGISGKVTYKVKKLEENKTLSKSVIHLDGTALPGEEGNAVLTGHSSSLGWSYYDSIFAALNKLGNGDEVYVYRNNEKFIYSIIEKRIVSSDDVSVLSQGSGEKLTLITCWPLGTDFRRLIVTAESRDSDHN